MKRGSWVGAILALALVTASCGQAQPVSGGGGKAFSGVTLRVQSLGGSYTDAQKWYLGDTFEQLTGARVEWITGVDQDSIAKLTAAKGQNPPFDLVTLDEPWVTIANNQGLLEKYDDTAIPNLKNLYPQALRPEQTGACLFFFSSGIVYNTQKFKENGLPEPPSYADLWNPKLAGHVGTQTVTATAVKYLIASAAIRLGDSPTDWEKALGEVAKIHFHSFSSSVSDLMAKLQSGDVWAAPIVNGRAWSLIDKGLPLKFVLPDLGNGKHGGIDCTTFNLVKGTPNKEAAEAFMNLAFSPGPQLAQAMVNPYAPDNRLLDPILKTHPAVADRVPWGQSIANGFTLTWDQKSLQQFPHYVDLWNHQVQK